MCVCVYIYTVGIALTRLGPNYVIVVFLSFIFVKKWLKSVQMHIRSQYIYV